MALGQEVEDTVVEFLQRGTTIEADVLANVKAILPVDVAQTITDLVPPPPTLDATVTDIVSVDPEVYYTSASASINQPGDVRVPAKCLDLMEVCLTGLVFGTCHGFVVQQIMSDYACRILSSTL